jgi:hypothetical protein
MSRRFNIIQNWSGYDCEEYNITVCESVLR